MYGSSLSHRSTTTAWCMRFNCVWDAISHSYDRYRMVTFFSALVFVVFIKNWFLIARNSNESVKHLDKAPHSDIYICSNLATTTTAAVASASATTKPKISVKTKLNSKSKQKQSRSYSTSSGSRNCCCVIIQLVPVLVCWYLFLLQDNLKWNEMELRYLFALFSAAFWGHFYRDRTICFNWFQLNVNFIWRISTFSFSHIAGTLLHWHTVQCATAICG